MAVMTDRTILSLQKNVKLVTTVLIGRETPDVLADFEFNEERTKLPKCSVGYELVSQNDTRSMRQCRISFDRNQCAICPYREQCRSKIHKKVASLTTSLKASNRAKARGICKAKNPAI